MELHPPANSQHPKQHPLRIRSWAPGITAVPLEPSIMAYYEVSDPEVSSTVNLTVKTYKLARQAGALILVGSLIRTALRPHAARPALTLHTPASVLLQRRAPHSNQLGMHASYLPCRIVQALMNIPKPLDQNSHLDMHKLLVTACLTRAFIPNPRPA